jgi:hypothetical protein
MKGFKSITLCTLAAALLVAGGCEREGPAEQAGEQIDETAGEIQDKAEAAGDEAMDSLEEAGDKIESVTDESAQ